MQGLVDKLRGIRQLANCSRKPSPFLERSSSAKDLLFRLAAAIMAQQDIKPFKVDISKEEVERLQRKLNDTRIPPKPIVPEAGDQYGPRYEWGKSMFEVSYQPIDLPGKLLADTSSRHGGTTSIGMSTRSRSIPRRTLYTHIPKVSRSVLLSC